jgi:hypothetical protein
MSLRKLSGYSNLLRAEQVDPRCVPAICCFQPALLPTQPPVQLVLLLFPRSKAAGAWRLPATPSSAEVKEILELYIYSLWHVMGRSLSL